MSDATSQLTGTEKQVAWAERIRAKHIDYITERISRTAGMDQGKVDALMAWLDSKTAAGWWIDRQWATGDEIVLEYAKEAM